MPRAFESDERDTIRRSLMQRGLKRFAKAGIRATRIDDICGDVGIAKGSFYAFFSSKEDLFMAIVEEREVLHRRNVISFLNEATGRPATLAGRLFDQIIAQIETDPLLNLVLVSGEIPYLRRKLGDERFAAGQAADFTFSKEAAALWGRGAGRMPMTGEDLLALLTVMLSLVSQRQNMASDQYGPAVAILRQLFVSRLTGPVT